MALPRFSKPLWHLVDARDQSVGRMASQVVRVLLGKHKPTFTPYALCGDYVVIVNAKDIHFTGKKKSDKQYTWHTGYPGGIKQKTVEGTLQDKPEEVLRKAILGMLRKNNLRYQIARRLRIFPGEKHLHEDMLPPGTPSILK